MEYISEQYLEELFGTIIGTAILSILALAGIDRFKYMKRKRFIEKKIIPL